VAGQSSEYRADMLLDSIKGSSKPIVTWWAAGSLSEPGIKRVNGSQVALFRSPERCASAVTSLVKYAQQLQIPPDAAVSGSDAGQSVSREKAGAILQDANASLSEHQSKKLLSLYGIPVTREQAVTTAHEAIGFAEEIGYPVVLKIDSPDILHKSEAGAIRLGVGSKAEIVRVYDEILDNARQYNPKARISGMLVQEMVQGGSEVMIGVSEDSQFGPTIAFGLGGIFVEVLKDISLRVAPLSTLDAGQMVTEIRGYPILQGVRGQKRADIAGIVDVILRISRLAYDWKDVISEIDINPLIVFDEGHGVKAADALVVIKAPGPH
jgi:acetyltransferase